MGVWLVPRLVPRLVPLLVPWLVPLLVSLLGEGAAPVAAELMTPDCAEASELDWRGVVAAPAGGGIRSRRSVHTLVTTRRTEAGGA